MFHAVNSPLNTHTHNPDSDNFTITCISPSDCLRSLSPKLKHPQPWAPPVTQPAHSSPLQRHVLILLGRCLQLRLKQAAADAARHHSRQLRGDGETGCRARCVRCMWLVTLLLRRLQRIA